MRLIQTRSVLWWQLWWQWVQHCIGDKQVVQCTDDTRLVQSTGDTWVVQCTCYIYVVQCIVLVAHWWTVYWWHWWYCEAVTLVVQRSADSLVVQWRGSTLVVQWSGDTFVLQGSGKSETGGIVRLLLTGGTMSWWHTDTCVTITVEITNHWCRFIQIVHFRTLLR